MGGMTDEEMLKAYLLLDPEKANEFALRLDAKNLGIEFSELINGLKALVRDTCATRHLPWGWAALNNTELMNRFDRYIFKNSPF